MSLLLRRLFARFWFPLLRSMSPSDTLLASTDTTAEQFLMQFSALSHVINIHFRLIGDWGILSRNCPFSETVKDKRSSGTERVL